MTTDDQQSIRELVRAVRGLTIVVGLLLMVTAARLGLEVHGYVRSLQSEPPPLAAAASPLDSQSESFDGKPFDDLTPEERIRHSSVVLLTKCDSSGARNRSIVAEIVKRRPGTMLYYSVGDEFNQMATSKCYDAVVFLVGSPAEMRFAHSYSDGRIGGMGGMPLSMLRELAAADDRAP